MGLYTLPVDAGTTNLVATDMSFTDGYPSQGDWCVWLIVKDEDKTR